MATQPVSPLVDVVIRGARTQMPFESCVEQLGSAIQIGIFRPGEKLPAERELAARLNVSRATLREAISALRAAGFVQTTRGRGGGTTVCDQIPSAHFGHETARSRRAEIDDVVIFRSVIEPGAAERAALTDLTPDQAALLEQALNDVSTAESPESYRRADARLHLSIASVCGSEELASACNHLQVKVHHLLAGIPFLERNIEHSDQQHRAIVRAILTKDAVAARQLMQDHCDGTAALLRGLLA
ncbi:FadR/GntR family transcriptional regulator [Microbacterium sp. NC79]|uniref:FadR/GntR family transcriptional regulator n=1 Tax=Microbacterium sp. NC79 TaxID=2851009 RepID=UPI001C2BCCA3|nr:FCD domain-containing protein [Microbacterium sp. NC79]MBV0895177.1 FCD domain-containing protein [Microbacterium sp. NC79]